MRAELTEGERAKLRVRDQLRRAYEDCKPFLDKSIPLEVPSVVDVEAVNRYYRRKHQRGQFGAYYLHQVAQEQFGAMRSMQTKRRV
jgi:hypothetical protein